MPNSSEIISSYLESEIARGSFPGAQYLVGEDHRIVAEDAVGLAVVEPEAIPTTLDTIYDLASLTKPLVTALLVVRFAEQEMLDLTAPLKRYLTEFSDQDKRGITLTQLLTHRSALPNWRPLYLEAETRSDVPAAIARILVECPRSGFQEVVYSDLGYILLGFVLERVTGERLDRLAEREIFDTLGLERTMFNPPPELVREIAATEHGQEFELANAVADAGTRGAGERGMRRRGEGETGREGDRETRRRGEGETRREGDDAQSPRVSPSPLRFPSSPRLPVSPSVSFVAPSSGLPVFPSPLWHQWRNGVIWGEVHDGNAKFMGGVAGHAGLFSTAREAFRIANQFLAGSELLKAESLHLFSDKLTPGCSTSRSIAWILAETPDCSAGPALPATAFGHNGFTGTSIWIDAEKRRVFVLLTNRIHPRVDAIDMREIRRRFNALAVETLDQPSDV